MNKLEGFYPITPHQNLFKIGGQTSSIGAIILCGYAIMKVKYVIWRFLSSFKKQPIKFVFDFLGISVLFIFFLPPVSNIEMVKDVVKVYDGSGKIVAGNKQKDKSKSSIDLFDQLAEQVVVAPPFVQYFHFLLLIPI